MNDNFENEQKKFLERLKQKRTKYVVHERWTNKIETKNKRAHLYAPQPPIFPTPPLPLLPDRSGKT